jgi:hypothetical protein
MTDPVNLSVTNPQVSATSTIDTSTATGVAIDRISNNPSVTTKPIDPIAASVNASLAALSASPAYGSQSNTGDKPFLSSSVPPASKLGASQPNGYKFNLPPHDWSLPIRPIEVDATYVGKTSDAAFHGLRRGRIWTWVGSDVTTNASSSASSDASIPVIDTSWGFQFLWNPTSISTNVTRNMDITPNSSDALRVVAGVFPGQETVSLDLIIDRTNDFACIKADENSNINFSRYYNSSYPYRDTTPSITTQIKELMAQGTMADLEYLFKAINGDSTGKSQWTNLLGKKTANVGYLSPTLLGIQLGPTLDNLSYVGWVSNLGLSHTAFTENMIPIRTEVTISIQCFSGSGITSGA